MTCPRGCCTSYAEHISSITARSGPSIKEANERTLSADLDAYKRLRTSGAKPHSIRGAHLMEKMGETVHEVETGHLIENRRLRAQTVRRFAEAPGPATTPLDAA